MKSVFPPWVRPALQLLYRRATARTRVLPSVFILGATKSGTSTMTNILWQHPTHVSPLTKELMYLQCLPNFVSNYEFQPVISFCWGRYSNGHAAYSPVGYRRFFPTRIAMEHRRRTFQRAITSDCDPFNLYCPIAMDRIRHFAIRPLFVIALRNPIDRAYSDYNMHRSRAGETRDFELVIRQELDGTETRFRKRFLNQSLYEPHVRRWFSAFPKEHFLIIKAEDLFADAALIAKQLFTFLDLPRADIDVTPKNVGQYTTVLQPKTRDYLRDYFHTHNERLYGLLGRDMEWR